MKLRLMKFLVDPYTKKPLKLKEFSSYLAHADGKEWREIQSGYLEAPNGRWYPIIKGVPRILPDAMLWKTIQDFYPEFLVTFKGRLPPIPSKYKRPKTHKKKTRTMKGFGYEWKKFPKIFKAYTKQFLGWIDPVDPKFFPGKLVLDAGCGLGRHIYHSNLWGAETIGIDLSEACEVAAENTKHQPKSHIVQADIYHLPFKDEIFDYIYCIGVLHHLPNPQVGFEDLCKKLKKNKHISIWVYGKEQNYLLKFVDPIRKYILAHLPLKVNLAMSYLMTIILYPLVKYVYKPLNANAATRPLAEWLPQNPFFNYLANFNFNIVHSIVFDQMLAPVAYYCSKREVLAWFKHASMKVLNVSWRNQNSWRAFGIKSVPKAGEATFK